MLTIATGEEYWDEKKEEFVIPKPCILRLEHSLLSISKWESTWKKPFIQSKDKTTEETIDYVRCMTINNNVDPSCYLKLSAKNVAAIDEYINDPHTATWFKKDQTGPKSREIITSELIYYWMLQYQIPFECEKWNLNRLLTLIEVCNEKNKKPKKQNMKDYLSDRAALNAARRSRHGSRG